MANSVAPDEMAHYEPFHLDLHYLHRYLFWGGLFLFDLGLTSLSTIFQSYRDGV